MAKVTIREVEVLNNDCSFVDKFQFKIRFDCIEDLQEDLDWKILYVGKPFLFLQLVFWKTFSGSANSTEFDQELDELSTGPIPVGVHEFVLEADGPDPTKIPASEIVGVTVVLITCSYRTQEFVRIGYYINNEYQDEQLREDPPEQPIVSLPIRDKFEYRKFSDREAVTCNLVKSARDSSANKLGRNREHHARAKDNLRRFRLRRATGWRNGRRTW